MLHSYVCGMETWNIIPPLFSKVQCSSRMNWPLSWISPFWPTLKKKERRGQADSQQFLIFGKRSSTLNWLCGTILDIVKKTLWHQRILIEVDKVRCLEEDLWIHANHTAINSKPSWVERHLQSPLSEQQYPSPPRQTPCMNKCTCMYCVHAVSYTHLTLPTIYSV